MSSASLIRGVNKIVARQTFGGDSKAGTPPTIGKGQFVSNVIQIRGSTVSGHNYRLNNQWGQYPISRTNQLGGIGKHATMGMFGSNADGVNLARRNADQAYVNLWNKKWPQVPP